MSDSEDSRESTFRSNGRSESVKDVRKIGRYTVSRRIGAGGMGEVYEAWDPLLDRRVALKRITVESVPDEEQRRLLLKEARAASSLQHRSIVAIHDVIKVGTEDYIVEEFAVGTSLRACLDRPFEIIRFFDFAEECVEALIVASGNGIVHCDLKPENILVTPEGLPRILDFGIAQRVVPSTTDSMITESPTIALDEFKPRGTPAYLAPELLTGDAVDSRVDIFSLGIVFYEMLTRRNPFLKGTVGATLTSVITDVPDPPDSLNDRIPKELSQLILRMMEKDRDLRPSGPAELLNELRRVRAQVVGSGRQGPLWRRIVGSWPGRIAAILVLAVFVLLAVRGFRPGGEDGPTVTPYVVVQPFENFTPDPAVGYFASGLLEAIETRLSNLQGVHIVDAGSDVGGTLSLEGSLQRAGDRLRISYRLVDREGIRLAGSVVEGGINELFELQDRVTVEITSALDGQFDVGDLRPWDRSRPTPDVLAYELYLQARGYLRSYENPANADVAIGLLNDALERDPGFALAHSGLADAYWRKWKDTKDPQWAQMAEQVSRTALEKGPNHAEIHVTLGTICRETGKLPQAMQEFQRAIVIDDKNDEAYVGLALTQERLSQPDSALGSFHRAIEARPDYWANMSQLGAFYARCGRLYDARTCFENVVALTPDNVRGHSNLGAVHVLLDEPERAIEAFERSLAIKPNYRAYSNLGYLYRSQGQMEKAAGNFETALILDSRDYRVWGSLGATYRYIPEMEAAADSACRRAIELAEPQLDVNPRDASLMVLVGQYYAFIGEPHRGRRLVERAVELAPDQMNVLFSAAVAYDTMGDHTSALDVLRKSLQAGLKLEAVMQEPALDSLRADPGFEEILREQDEIEGQVQEVEPR